jgi:hypothetical protein
MPWAYKKAIKRGNDIIVTLENADDPENVLTHDLTWGKDPDVSWAQFKAMVKREVKNWLTHLNSTVAETDVTDDYKPKISA